MTFSIVARSDDCSRYGVAVASKFLAVGAAVPAAEADVGAIATQAYANLAFGPQGLALLRTGATPKETLAGLVAADGGRMQRQIGIIGAEGSAATYTGDACASWAGGRAGEDYAVQGNILTGPEVIDAMARAWREGTGERFPERLMMALAAGESAGGDSRGKQSAALHVVGKSAGYGGTSDIEISLRVDDHPEPVSELERLLGLHRLYFDTARRDEVLVLDAELAAEVRELLAELGHSGEVEPALQEWAGIANLEERLIAGHIDPLVLAALRREAGIAGQE